MKPSFIFAETPALTCLLSFLGGFAFPHEKKPRFHGNPTFWLVFNASIWLPLGWGHPSALQWSLWPSCAMTYKKTRGWEGFGESWRISQYWSLSDHRPHDFKHFQCRSTLELSTGESTPSGPRSGTALEILTVQNYSLFKQVSLDLWHSHPASQNPLQSWFRSCTLRNVRSILSRAQGEPKILQSLKPVNPKGFRPKGRTDARIDMMLSNDWDLWFHSIPLVFWAWLRGTAIRCIGVVVFCHRNLVIESTGLCTPSWGRGPTPISGPETAWEEGTSWEYLDMTLRI